MWSRLVGSRGSLPPCGSLRGMSLSPQQPLRSEERFRRAPSKAGPKAGGRGCELHHCSVQRLTWGPFPESCLGLLWLLLQAPVNACYRIDIATLCNVGVLFFLCAPSRPSCTLLGSPKFSALCPSLPRLGSAPPCSSACHVGMP